MDMTTRRPVIRRRDERGAAMVEFAMILPLLVLLTFGIIEFGVAFNASSSVSQASRAGGRTAAIFSSDPQLEFNAGLAAANALDVSPNSITGNPTICVSMFVAGGDPCTDQYSMQIPVAHFGGAGNPTWQTTYAGVPAGAIPAGNDNWPVAKRNFGCPPKNTYDRVSCVCRYTTTFSCPASSSSSSATTRRRRSHPTPSSSSSRSRRTNAALREKCAGSELRRTRRGARLACHHARSAPRRNRASASTSCTGTSRRTATTCRRRGCARRCRDLPGQCRGSPIRTRRGLRQPTATTSARLNPLDADGSCPLVGTTTVCGGAGDKPYQYKVTVAAEREELLRRHLRHRDHDGARHCAGGLHRTAQDGQSVEPVRQRPRHDARDAADLPELLGNIAGGSSVKQKGDAYAAGYCDVPTDGCSGIGPNKNLDFNPLGYVYAVDFKSTQTVNLQAFDPDFVNVGDTCTTGNLAGAAALPNVVGYPQGAPNTGDRAIRYGSGSRYCTGDNLFTDHGQNGPPPDTTYTVLKAAVPGDPSTAIAGTGLPAHYVHRIHRRHRRGPDGQSQGRQQRQPLARCSASGRPCAT